MSDLKVIKCEPELDEECLSGIIEEMQSTKKFVVIYFGLDQDGVTFHTVNMSAMETLASLDMVKFKVMTEHLA